MSKSTPEQAAAGCVSAVLALVLLCFVIMIRENYHPETIEGEVINTYIKRFDEKDRFMVVVEKENGETETFQIRDTILNGIDLRAADHWGKLRQGTRIRARASGVRSGLGSVFRILIHINTLEKK